MSEQGDVFKEWHDEAWLNYEAAPEIEKWQKRVHGLIITDHKKTAPPHLDEGGLGRSREYSTGIQSLPTTCCFKKPVRR